MTTQSPQILRERGRSLEEEFFRREDHRLIEPLRAPRETETARGALARAARVTDPVILDRLMALGVRAETFAALAVVPPVGVARADGTLDARERRAVLDRAQDSGLAPGSTEYALQEVHRVVNNERIDAGPTSGRHWRAPLRRIVAYKRNRNGDVTRERLVCGHDHRPVLDMLGQLYYASARRCRECPPRDRDPGGVDAPNRRSVQSTGPGRGGSSEDRLAQPRA